MNILIIGGTRFLGRHIAEAALAKGHRLTLFHRGKTGADLFPEAEHIHGDRETDLHLLDGREWAAVIDTCGYFPRIVRLSCEALKGRVDQYVFISSISVYSDLSSPPDESSTVGKLEDEAIEEITGESYGPLKALCEQVVSDTFGEAALNLRPGLIVGPYDPTDRFAYWPVRFHRGGRVLAPDVKGAPVQIMDVRDLAAWTVDMVEKRKGGTFNATGPVPPISVEAFITGIQQAVNPAAEIIWVPAEILEKHHIEPWGELAAILPYDGSMDNMARADVSRAVAEGLTFTPLSKTAKDTLDWWQEAGQPDLKAGLAPEKEEAALSEA